MQVVEAVYVARVEQAVVAWDTPMLQILLQEMLELQILEAEVEVALPLLMLVVREL
jgi:hypothetical protein